MWRLCVDAPVVDMAMLVLDLGFSSPVNSKLLANVTMAALKIILVHLPLRNMLEKRITDGNIIFGCLLMVIKFH